MWNGLAQILLDIKPEKLYLRILHCIPKDFGMLFISTIGVYPTAESMFGIIFDTGRLK